MSTKLKLFASVMPATPITPTTVSHLFLTKFSAGPSGGAKLQVSVQSGISQFGVQTIHLNKAQIKDLINTLQEAFSLTEEPDFVQDEEILSNCCGAEPWTGNESMCRQCFEHADFN